MWAPTLKPGRSSGCATSKIKQRNNKGLEMIQRLPSVAGVTILSVFFSQERMTRKLNDCNKRYKGGQAGSQIYFLDNYNSISFKGTLNKLERQQNWKLIKRHFCEQFIHSLRHSLPRDIAAANFSCYATQEKKLLENTETTMFQDLQELVPEQPVLGFSVSPPGINGGVMTLVWDTGVVLSTSCCLYPPTSGDFHTAPGPLGDGIMCCSGGAGRRRRRSRRMKNSHFV